MAGSSAGGPATDDQMGLRHGYADARTRAHNTLSTDSPDVQVFYLFTRFMVLPCRSSVDRSGQMARSVSLTQPGGD